ncbi:dephospho-CoA kinase [bacterium SCSIO 12741]|nr:dephospho-CoA kinase [bacterium SCSIO 12741]
MKQIGITGGIGSGKTTVSRIFQSLGIPLYEADSRAKKVSNKDPEVRQQIIQLFGDKAYDGGTLNRPFLAGEVFSQPDKLQQLNGIIHPAVGRDYEQWVSFQRQTPYTLKEAAILFESGSNRFLKAVILVTAPEELRIQRVMDRDGTNREEVLKRMANQWSDDKKRELSQFEIINDGKSSLIKQVMNIHEQILTL